MVELDLFSGRPNPRWSLSVAQAAELSGLLARLEASSATQEDVLAGLGYRGFRIEGGEDGPAIVWRGRYRSRSRRLADPERTIEWFLLDQLPPEHAGLRAVVARELSAPPQSE